MQVQTFRAVISFSSNTKHVGAATAGSNAGGGVANRFDVNGAIADIRRVRWTTAGSEWWRLHADTTAEGGSSAGSLLTLDSRDDSGNALANICTITRPGDIIFGVLSKTLTVRSHIVKGAAFAPITAGAAASAASAVGTARMTSRGR